MEHYMEYRRVTTSREVWAVIHARHGDELVVHGSASHPQGSAHGNPTEASMFTSYGFKDAPIPLIEAKTTWDFNHEKPSERANEHTDFWLCTACQEDD